MRDKKPELLLPAKDLITLKVAIHYGADAVYMGGKSFGLRKGATNFTFSEMSEGVDFAHAHGKKVYLTANIVAKNADINEAEAYFGEIEKIGFDGILVSDPGLYRVIKDRVSAPIHISTQAGNSNYETFNFWYDLGIRRVVCERLLTLSEIKEIREKVPTDLEIEAFVHGAMCISYSGRCLLSAALTGRDANHGDCTHPCRWEYNLSMEDRPGQYFPMEEDGGGTYILNSKDLCMIDMIPKLVGAGIDSFKIEGRMKNALYVATMAKAYREAIDTYLSDPDLYERKKPELIKAVRGTTHRPYSHGFYEGDEGKDGLVCDNSNYVVESVYLGVIEKTEGDYVYLTQKNKFLLGESIEVFTPGGDNKSCKVLEIFDDKGEPTDSAPHSKQKLKVKLSAKTEAFDILCRRQKS